MNEWKIQSHGSKCSECGVPFEDKQTYRTLLYGEEEELLRKDLCTDCYKKVEKTLFSSTDAWISSWKGKYRKPPPRPKEAVQKDQVEKILLEVVGDRENYQVHDGTLYILAAMLERKKVIKLRDTVQKGEKRIFVYEHGATGDVFTVDDVKLNSEAWGAVHHQVTGLMTLGLEYFNPEAENAEVDADEDEGNELKESASGLEHDKEGDSVSSKGPGIADDRSMHPEDRDKPSPHPDTNMHSPN